MRFVPTFVHGILDYLGAALLIAFPFLLGFQTDGVGMWFLVVLGVGVICYTLLTDFELGLLRKMPVAVHLAIDALVGLALLTAPFFIGFREDVPVLWPFIVMGLVELSAAFVTKLHPADRERAPAQHSAVTA